MAQEGVGGVTDKQLEVLMRGMAPVIREFVAQTVLAMTDPYRLRLDALQI